MNNNNKNLIKKKLKIFYEKLSIFRKKSRHSRSMEWTAFNSEKQASRIVDALDMPNLSIADIGGSDGEYLFQLASKGKFSPSSEITLIDISPYYLGKAAKKYNLYFKNKFKFKTMRLDVDDLKLKNKFDIVFFRNILEHIYFPDNAIWNLKNSIRSKGLLFILTPNRNRLNEFLKRFVPKKSAEKLKLKFGTDVPEVLLLENKMGLKEHIHEYSLNEIKQLLKRHNFRIIKIGYSPVPFIVPSLCDRYLPLFLIQKALIVLAGAFKLNRLFGFEYSVLAEKE
jgi:2-polyprenyl-3-methyl-5-hydroxy-6-metoxy-1,4-benzoquinol methylase